MRQWGVSIPGIDKRYVFDIRPNVIESNIIFRVCNDIIGLAYTVTNSLSG